MAVLVAAALCLFASHAVLSAPGVRPALIGSLGRPTFQALHAALSTAALALFIWTYAGLDQNRLLYAPLPGAGRVAVAAMPFAFLLVVARLLTPLGELTAPRAPRGIYRITRHPGSIGLTLWAGLHLASTGDAKRVILFGTMAAIALFAVVKNEWVLRRARSPEARAFRSATSLLPFAAIARGRQRAQLSEIGWLIPLLALAAYAGMLSIHPLLFGVDPLDGFGQSR